VLLNEGLKEILYKTYDMLSKIEREPLEEEVDITKLLKELKIEKDDFEITRDEEDAIVVGGRIVDDVLAKYVIGMDDESLITFLHMMRNLGMEEALQEFGVQDGDTVKIADVEFEYFE
jgi:GTPase obg